jgi:hypothetical protein
VAAEGAGVDIGGIERRVAFGNALGLIDNPAGMLNPNTAQPFCLDGPGRGSLPNQTTAFVNRRRVAELCPPI